MEDRIKLEEELEFLKESFEAEVITKDEYEKAKKRIEKKLKELEEESIETKEEEKPKEEIIEEKKEKQKTLEEKPEIKEEPEIEIKEIKESGKFKEPWEKEVKEERPIEVEVFDEKEKDTNDIITFKKEFKIEKEKRKINIWMPIAIIIFLIVIGYFSFSFFTGEKNTEKQAEEILPLCFSDTGCVKEGMIGFCNNPGKENANCEFKEDVKVNFIVLNNKDCFNCDTARVEKIIRGWFPGAVKKEIELNSEEGEDLVENFSIKLLPAFIFDSNLEETFRYKEFKNIFTKVNDKFILSSGASGSTFYINKKEIPNRLDVFLMKDDISTEKAEENIEEFLDFFKDKIEYNEHLVDKENNLVRSLDINTFPTFLINNKIRFSGVQPAETIKENFCELNKLEQCSKKLSESLV